jgi:hypothetical protein
MSHFRDSDLPTPATNRKYSVNTIRMIAGLPAPHWYIDSLESLDEIEVRRQSSSNSFHRQRNAQVRLKCNYKMAQQ